MKLLHIVLLILISGSLARILDEHPLNGLVQVESTTISEAKEKIEPAEIPANVTKPDPCFYADTQRFCFNKTGSEQTNCECEQHPDNELALVCCNVTDILKSIACFASNISIYSDIHIINAQQKELNLKLLHPLKHFNSLSITDGNITKLTEQYSKFSSIKCLNFSNNNITEISERALLYLSQLQVLDLSANNLTKLPSPPQNASVDIRGNLKVSCQNVLSAIDRKVKFLYKESSACEVATVYHWFNSTASISIQNLENMKKVESDCPDGCHCQPDRMFYSKIEGGEDSLMFIAKVDCSNLGLTKLPLQLPDNTQSLNISNNSISSLSALVDNSYYQNLQSLYADDNLIKSIVELEGSKFLENFTKLSLKNNKIKDIPFYILSNLERNLNGKLVYLGGNRITCDCQTFKNQRIWRLVQDFEKILCENMQARILELKESQLCKSGYHDWASYIDYLICFEVFLLVALITKVSYDWYVYKHSGFLPYPASWIILYNHPK